MEQSPSLLMLIAFSPLIVLFILCLILEGLWKIWKRSHSAGEFFRELGDKFAFGRDVIGFIMLAVCGILEIFSEILDLSWSVVDFFISVMEFFGLGAAF